MGWAVLLLLDGCKFGMAILSSKYLFCEEINVDIVDLVTKN